MLGTGKLYETAGFHNMLFTILRDLVNEFTEALPISLKNHG